MQHPLHMRTTFFIVSVIGLVLFACMVYILRTRKTYPGFAFWTASSLFYFLGNILIGFRGMFPDVITVIMANMFLVFTVWSILHGLILFYGHAFVIWPCVTITTCIFLNLVYFTSFNPNINARIFILSFAFIFFCLYALITINKSTSQLSESANPLVKISLYSAVGLSAFRTGYTLLFETNIETFLTASPIQTLSIILFCSLFVSLFFGLSILNFQRVENDLFNSKKAIRELEGIVPMCASCKKIRDDSGFWSQVESYIQSHSSAKLSHAICPECMDKLYPEYSNKK